MPIPIAASAEGGPLGNLIAKMTVPSPTTAPRIWMLNGTSPVPHAPPSDSLAVSPVNVQQIGGTFVGIAQVAEKADNHLLCSDSFAPCVPVIVFKETTTILAHCNGTGRAPDIKAMRDGGVVVVVRKKNHPRQSAVADKLIELLEDGAQPVYVCDVDPKGYIGVVVYGQTKSVIVYEQG
jgi:hypothetical protein